MAIDPNKKKIRGWKKQTKKITDWHLNHENPDLEHFNNYGEDFVKIRIDPWNRLMERQPPGWYCKIILERLIEIHNKWYQYYSLNQQNFDLQLWINEPKFIRSQVVCAKTDKPDEFRNNYYRPDKSDRKFPSHKWQSINYNLDEFSFEPYMDENLHFKNLEELTDEEIDELLSDGYNAESTEINGNPEIMYSKRVGTVWIGRKK